MKWVGDYYLRMTLEWNYHHIHSERNVRLSMPGYVKEALIEFKHHFIKQQFSASPYKDPIYGRKYNMQMSLRYQHSQRNKSTYYKEYAASSYTTQEQLIVQ